MIVSRRPFVIFDVDVAFSTGLLVVLVLGYFLLVQPSLARRAALGDATATLGKLQADIEESRGDAAHLRQEIAALETGVARRAATIPQVAQRDRALRDVLETAKPFSIEFEQIVPQSPQIEDGRATSDVQLQAGGSANDIIRWLDTLSRTHPYVSYEHLSLRGGETCTLSARFRLHLLATPAAEESP